MKKIILLLFITLLTNSYGCKFFKSQDKPSISIKDLKLKKLTFKSVTFTVILDIYNPYPVGGTAKYLNWGVDINNKSLFYTKSKGGFKINSESHAYNPVDVKMTFSKIYDIVTDYSKRDKFDYTIKGEVGVDVPSIGTYNLPFSKTASFPTIKLKVSIANFSVGSPKVSGGNITVSEMNYAGFAKKSRRTLSSKSRVIKGFIY